MHPVRVRNPDNLEITSPGAPEARDMLSALARLKKHGAAGEFDCEIDEVADADWDRLAGQFDDISYDQTASFAAGLWGDRTSHLMLRRGGEVVAGARLAIFRLPGFSRGLAFLRFGPFWRRHGQKPDISIYRAVVGAVAHEYCIRHGHFLSIIPRANPEFYSQESEVLAEFGFGVRRTPPDPNRYLVDLSLGEDEQMRSLDQKWRYNLRQATANNFDIRLGENESDIRTFQSLHAGMVTRKGFFNSDLVHMLPELSAQLPEALRLHTVLAFHQGRAVIGAAIGILGDTAYYVFGGSDRAALSLKGGYALHWWIVRWLSQQHPQARWYDLGGEAGEQGLRQFKKGLAGKRGTVIAANEEHDYWSHPSARIMGDALYAVRDLQRSIRRWRYGG
jgi:hypothetical protein